MTTQSDARNRFRGAFVMLLVAVTSLAFLATIKGFLAALFMAAVFTGLVYPLYRWILARFPGRENLASLTTMLIVIIAGVLPLTGFLGIVAGQAVEVSKIVAPWVERHLQDSADGGQPLPEWIPFVCCIGCFASVKPAHDSRKDRSALTVVWYQDNFAMPIDPAIQNELRSLNWNEHATDGEY